MRQTATIESIHKAAQAWCTPSTEKIVMIPELAEAFAEILDEVIEETREELYAGCR